MARRQGRAWSRRPRTYFGARLSIATCPLRLDQPHLLREPPAVRYQAECSNDCRQFDMSPFDLKHIDKPDWIDPSKGVPTLMPISVVDDHSGVSSST